MRRQVGVIASWQVAASLCYYGVFAAGPLFRDTFGLTRVTVGVLVTTLTLGYTLALFPSGALVDAYGEKPVMVGGLLALAAGVLAVAAAPTQLVLFAAAIALGVAYATAMPATNRAVVAHTTPEDRGFAMGVKMVGVTVGSGLAAVLVVSIGPGLGAWNTGFWLVAALALGAVAVFGLTYRGDRGHGRIERPDLRRLLDVPGYPLLTAIGATIGASIFTTVGYLTLYLTDTTTTAAVAGVAFAGFQLAGAAGRLLAGAIADRIPGDPTTATTGLFAAQTLLGGLAIVGLVLAPSRTATLVLVPVVGLTLMGNTGLYYASLSQLVPDDAIGTATAGGQTAINIGGLLAPPAFGLLATGAGYDVAWAGVAAVTALGALLAARLARRTPTRTL